MLQEYVGVLLEPNNKPFCWNRFLSWLLLQVATSFSQNESTHSQQKRGEAVWLHEMFVNKSCLNPSRGNMAMICQGCNASDAKERNETLYTGRLNEGPWQLEHEMIKH